MKLLYIADGHSPIALNWISFFIQNGHEVHLASTYPCQGGKGIASVKIIPVATSGSYIQTIGGRGEGRLARRLIPVSLRTKIRQLMAPWTFPQAAKVLREVIKDIQPDLVHAMRIPFEGMITAIAMKGGREGGGNQYNMPLLVSVWGNDFTLHARSTSGMEAFTRKTLQACDALHTDCQRDMSLARVLGFTSSKPNIILPGGGGINLDIFHPAEKPDLDEDDRTLFRIINPRGIRAYVRNDTFFKAIPLVLKRYPNTRFLCPGMEGEIEAQRWIKKLSIDGYIELLPIQSPAGMSELFRQAPISVSITTHDGTPNTLLEAMACGCFPIAGDIESLREWITPAENGLLVDPGDARGLAEAIIRAIKEPGLRMKAHERNLRMVQERAEHGKTMARAEEFYRSLVRNRG